MDKQMVKVVDRDEFLYKVKELDAKDCIILDLAIGGMKNKEIAEQLGVSKKDVTRALTCPAGKKYIAEVMMLSVENSVDVRAKLEAVAHDAVGELWKIINDEEMSHQLKLDAIKEALKFAGYEPQKKEVNQHLHAHIGADAVRNLYESQREILGKMNIPGVSKEELIEAGVVVDG